MADFTYTESLPEIYDYPVQTKTQQVVSAETGKVLGQIIIATEVDISQKVKCITSCGDESFTYSIHGRIYLDFPSGIKDVTFDDEVTTIWIY